MRLRRVDDPRVRLRKFQDDASSHLSVHRLDRQEALDLSEDRLANRAWVWQRSISPSIPEPGGERRQFGS